MDEHARPGTKAAATVRNSILRGFVASLAAEGGGKVDASYSDYDGSGNLSPGGEITESSISNVGAAGFAGPGRLPAGAGLPARRRGRSRAAQQGLDLAGNPLVADGNGDGAARRDIGAYELPARPSRPRTAAARARTRRAPVLSGFASTRKAFAKRTRFRFTLSEAARVTIRIQRSSACAGTRKRYRTVATIGASRHGRPEQHRLLAEGRPPAAARRAVPRDRARHGRRTQPVGAEERGLPHRALARELGQRTVNFFVLRVLLPAASVAVSTSR